MDDEISFQDPLPNYKIPKKTSSDSNDVQNYATPLNWGPPVTNIDSPGLTGSWGQQNDNSRNDSPLVTYNFSAYKKPPEKEVPKNVNVNKRPFLDTCPDLSDPTLPKELTSQFQPLFCKLCQARLHSNVNAMLHYKSKNHEKKVRNFLIHHSEETGEPLHKRVKGKSEEKDEENPRNSYCEVCDLTFTSKMHADQHYMGKNHHKALMGYSKPAGNCFMGEDGKWHRVAKTKEDETGRSGIGLGFVTTEEKQKIIQSKFYCTICSVSATSNENLEKHYNGQKHQKKLKQLSGNTSEMAQTYQAKTIYDSQTFYEPMDYDSIDLYKPNVRPGVEMDSENEWYTFLATAEETVNQKSEPENDTNAEIGKWEPITPSQPEKKSTSNCRTPSGQYYCQICNITLNSEMQYFQHTQSKRHAKNSQSFAAIKSSAH